MYIGSLFISVSYFNNKRLGELVFFLYKYRESVKMFSPKSIDIIYEKIDFIYKLC